MLIRPGGRAKPRIVGNIDEPVRTFLADHRAGKENFITDQRADRRCAGNCKSFRSWTCSESRLAARDLGDPDPVKQRGTGYVFAEGNKPRFIVNAEQLGTRSIDEERIEKTQFRVELDTLVACQKRGSVSQ